MSNRGDALRRPDALQIDNHPLGVAQDSAGPAHIPTRNSSSGRNSPGRPRSPSQQPFTRTPSPQGVLRVASSPRSDVSPRQGPGLVPRPPPQRRRRVSIGAVTYDDEHNALASSSLDDPGEGAGNGPSGGPELHAGVSGGSVGGADGREEHGQSPPGKPHRPRENGRGRLKELPPVRRGSREEEAPHRKGAHVLQKLPRAPKEDRPHAHLPSGPRMGDGLAHAHGNGNGNGNGNANGVGMDMMESHRAMLLEDMLGEEPQKNPTEDHARAVSELAEAQRKRRHSTSDVPPSPSGSPEREPEDGALEVGARQWVADVWTDGQLWPLQAEKSTPLFHSHRGFLPGSDLQAPNRRIVATVRNTFGHRSPTHALAPDINRISSHPHPSFASPRTNTSSLIGQLLKGRAGNTVAPDPASVASTGSRVGRHPPNMTRPQSAHPAVGDDWDDLESLHNGRDVGRTEGSRGSRRTASGGEDPNSPPSTSRSVAKSARGRRRSLSEDVRSNGLVGGMMKQLSTTLGLQQAEEKTSPDNSGKASKKGGLSKWGVLTGKTGDASGMSEVVEAKLMARKLAAKSKSTTEQMTKSRWAQAKWYATQEAAHQRADNLMQRNSKDRIAYLFSRGSDAMRNASFAPGAEGLALSNTHGSQLQGSLMMDGSVPWHKWLAFKMRAVERSRAYIVLHVLMMAWILLAVDLYMLTNPDTSSDMAVFGVTALCFAGFVTDFLLRILFHERYFSRMGGAFIDLISILSLVPDVVWFLTEEDILARAGLGYHDSLVLTRGGRAIRAGSKCARLFKMFSYFLRLLGIKKQIGSDEGGIMEEYLQQSHLNRMVHRQIERHTVALVVVMLLISFGVEVINPRHEFEEYAQSSINILADAYEVTQSADGQPGPALQPLVASFLAELESRGSPALFLMLGGSTGFVWGDRAARSSYRTYPVSEVVEVTAACPTEEMCVLHTEVPGHVRLEAYGNLLLVMCITVAIVAMTWMLSGKLQRDVVQPVERMVYTVSQLSVNPLRPLKKSEGPQLLETNIVENALIKFGSLLQVGFGEAGAKIITSNLQDGSIDTNIPGTVVTAFFGFCDIRNFTDFTEVLQADVVKVVNGIAEHVHNAVYENYGAPNKNIGDAFLMVWKPQGRVKVQDVADGALRSYIRIIIEISRSKELSRIANKTDIQRRLPGYYMRLGFGLHYGWAIECTIGSTRKIDASYLSPHVNLSSRLEAATKQYGVEILLSEDTLLLLSPSVQDLLRMVDRVTVKGSIKPMELYTFDVPVCVSRGGSLGLDIDVSDTTLTAEEFFKLVPPSTDQNYRQKFAVAMDFYIGGPDGSQADWTTAKVLLEECLVERPADGPAQAILEYMMSAANPDGSNPTGWQGYRSLDKK